MKKIGLAVLLAAVAIVGAPEVVAQPTIVYLSADPFAQSSFPCEEDEVLGYAPEFGPDRVGCMAAGL